MAVILSLNEKITIAKQMDAAQENSAASFPAGGAAITPPKDNTALMITITATKVDALALRRVFKAICFVVEIIFRSLVL